MPRVLDNDEIVLVIMHPCELGLLWFVLEIMFISFVILDPFPPKNEILP